VNPDSALFGVTNGASTSSDLSSNKQKSSNSQSTATSDKPHEVVISMRDPQLHTGRSRMLRLKRMQQYSNHQKQPPVASHHHIQSTGTGLSGVTDASSIKAMGRNSHNSKVRRSDLPPPPNTNILHDMIVNPDSEPQSHGNNGNHQAPNPSNINQLIHQQQVQRLQQEHPGRAVAIVAKKQYENIMNIDWYYDNKEDGNDDWYRMDADEYYQEDEDEDEDEEMNDDYYRDLLLYEQSVRNLKRAEELRTKAQALLRRHERERRY